METITIHWGFAFILPLAGAFVARQYYVRWQAWVAAAAMSLIGALMIILIGHGTLEYAMVALLATWVIGAFLPDIWHGVSAAVRTWLSRTRNVFYLVAGAIGLAMLVYRPDLFAKSVAIGLIFLVGRQMVRSFMKF